MQNTPNIVNADCPTLKSKFENLKCNKAKTAKTNNNKHTKHKI